MGSPSTGGVTVRAGLGESNQRGEKQGPHMGLQRSRLGLQEMVLGT